MGFTQLIHQGRVDESRLARSKRAGLAMAIAKAVELKIKDLVIPTAGNAGGALAAYAARAEMRAHVFMPRDAPQRKSG